MSEPRNYLEEATDFIGAPKSLPILLKNNREEVIYNLLNALNSDEGLMAPSIRKAAAYALGQIGEIKAKDPLKRRLGVESASGVRDAIVASITAINIAPDESGHSQLVRRKIIKDVYDGNRKPDLS